MGEVNPHQKWANGVNVLARSMRKKAKESDIVPFGQERLTPKAARVRFENMTQPERQKFIADKGETEVLKMLRGK